MTTIKKSNLHYTFDKSLKYVNKINNFEEVTFECVDCYNNQIYKDDITFQDIDRNKNNPATGPVYIDGAKKGDILKITIKDIKVNNSGVMAIRPNAGLFGDIIKEQSKIISIIDNYAIFNDTKIKLEPMIGVIGVATEEPILTTIPGEHGGNLDIKDIGIGSTVFLPVYVDGGLLSLGDLHGIQGDGEVAVCALELDGSVLCEIEVLKNRKDIPTPFIISQNKYITTSAKPTLDEAVKTAADKMLFFLESHTNLTLEECAMIISLKGNTRISQVVNDLKGSIVDFPMSLLNVDFTY